MDKIAVPMMSREMSLSDSCTPDNCINPIKDLKAGDDVIFLSESSPRCCKIHDFCIINCDTFKLIIEIIVN